MNDHSDVTYDKPFPRGWNGSDCKYNLVDRSSRANDCSLD